MFPSIPIDLAKEVATLLLLENTLDKLSDSIMLMLYHWLNNFCEFDGEYYKQSSGVLMGLPISGFIAEVGMQSIEANDCGSDMLMTRLSSLTAMI